MTEKKLTDEEIVKALDNCANNHEPDACDKCPLLDKKCLILTKSALDLIQRLQNENGQLEAYNNGLEYEVEQLQKQVDELKAKNSHLDSENTRLICEMDKMLDEGWDIMDEEADGWYKKGCKDTAKEIADWLLTTESDKENLAKIIKEHYCVEVK